MKVHATPQQVEKIKKMRPDLNIKTLPSGSNEYMVEGVSDEQFVNFLRAKGMDIEQHESTATIKELTITDQKAAPAQPMTAQSIPEPINQKESAPAQPEPEKITAQAVNENPNLAFNMLVSGIAQTLIKPVLDKLDSIDKRLTDLEKRHQFNSTQVEAATNNLFLETQTLRDALTTFVAKQETINQGSVVQTQNNVDEHKKITENVNKLTKYLRDAPLLS